MFENLPNFPPDKILSLMALFRDDPSEGKIDLGVGVYRDASGNTPVMAAIKQAEQRLWEEQTSKAYTGLAGDTVFAKGMKDLVLADSVDHDRVAAAVTPGGTGACRQAFELARMLSPDLRVFVSDPSWPNHKSILNHLKIETLFYRYFDSESGAVQFEAMMEDLDQLRAGDVLLLHGCCHNPTGANLRPDQMLEAGRLASERGALVMIDLAYQGFGDGLDEDAAGTRALAAALPEMLIAASCSKNFGIYRERTGLLMALGQDAETTAHRQTALNHLNRQNYSFPPDHGARIAGMVLADPKLKADWMAELEAMRKRMLTVRESLASALRNETGSDRFGFIAQHRGMFSLTGLNSDQVQKLRENHAVYMVGDSRMNIAGLSADSVPLLASAIAAVSRT